MTLFPPGALPPGIGTSTLPKPSSLPRFGEKKADSSGEGSDVFSGYKTNLDAQQINIPYGDEKFMEKLDALTQKIKAGEYTVEPESGRYKGPRKKFNLKSYVDHSEHFLRHGSLRITPQNSKSDIAQILLSRTRGPKKNKTLTIEMHTRSGSVLIYRHQGGVDTFNDVTLYKFIESAAGQLGKTLRNEQHYKPAMLDKLNF